MLLLVIGLILFVFLVVAHEYGHFLAAKLSGVRVEEFGVGFPPRLIGKKIGKGIWRGYYSLNLLPLGGFVKLKGEHDGDTSKGAFGSVSLRSKLKIIYAGVIVNLLVSIVMLTVVAWVGMPQLVDNQFKIASDSKTVVDKLIVNYIEPQSPAEKAGLKSGDVIVSINNQNIKGSTKLRNITKSSAGQTVNINYVRNGQNNKVQVTLLSEKTVQASLKTNQPKAYLGISNSSYTVARSTWSAPVVAVGNVAQLSWLTLKGLGGALANLGKSLASAVTGHGQQAKQEASAAGENVSGPVGIYFILRQGSVLGFEFILFVVAIISLTLALINALPIPALDGGRAFVMLLFRAIKKPLPPKTEDIIHGTGFALLMLLFVVITIVDIKRFF